MNSDGKRRTTHGKTMFCHRDELAERSAGRDISPVEVVDAYLKRIEQRNRYKASHASVGRRGSRPRARGGERLSQAGVRLGRCTAAGRDQKTSDGTSAAVPSPWGRSPFANNTPQNTTQTPPPTTQRA